MAPRRLLAWLARNFRGQRQTQGSRFARRSSTAVSSVFGGEGGGATEKNRKSLDATAASVRKVSLMATFFATEAESRTSGELFPNFLAAPLKLHPLLLLPPIESLHLTATKTDGHQGRDLRQASAWCRPNLSCNTQMKKSVAALLAAAASCS